MYGVRVTGLDECSCLEPVPDSWPEWTVTTEVIAGQGEQCIEIAEHTRGRLCFSDGSAAETTRTASGGAIHVRLSRDVDRCLIAHPYLATIGMFDALWRNRLPIHAGTVGIDGRAWLILGTKGGGKSTTLLLLEQAGYPVLSDDLSIIDPDLNVHRGPAFIDLRQETAHAMGIGEELGVLGARERWRHPIENRPLTLPLGGIVLAEWGNADVTPLKGGAKIQAVAGNLSLSVPGPWNDLFMEIVTTIPALTWTRPKNLAEAESGIAMLLSEIRTSY
jgi:hypothetical protein